MHPISEVEKDWFRDLIGACLGDNKLDIKGRTFFTEKLKREASQTKTQLVLALQGPTWVSSTGDLWTCHGRSYLGMTVHWIGEDLVRRSAMVYSELCHIAGLLLIFCHFDTLCVYSLPLEE